MWAWQTFAFAAVVWFAVRGWWRMVAREWRQARTAPTPVEVPAAAAGCLHARVVDVVSGMMVVAQLCLDCDEQLPVRNPAWP